MRFLLAAIFIFCCPAAYAQTYIYCDGSTDNTATIQQAIDSQGQGDPIDLYNGSGQNSPCMTGPLTMRTYRHLDCHGATLKLNAAGTLFTTANFASLTGSDQPYGAGAWSVRNCDLDGSGQSGNGFKIYGWQFLLENLTIHDFSGDGIYSEWSTTPGCPYQDGTTNVITNGCMEAYVHNVKSFHNGGWGMRWAGPHDSVLDTNWNFQNAQGGFRLLNGSLRIDHMHNYGDGPYEFEFDVGLDYGNDLYGEGASTAQFWIAGASIIPFLIATNCGSGDGVQLTGAGTGSFIGGGACNVNWLTQGTGAIQLNAPLKGLVPPSTVVGQSGIWQAPIGGVTNCVNGIKTDANGTYHC